MEPDDEGRTAGRCPLHVHLALVAVRDVPHDGQAEAGTAAVAGAGGVEAGESIEDPFPILLPDSVAVVGHHELRHVGRTPNLDEHDRLGVPLRVVEQLGQHSPEPRVQTAHQNPGDDMHLHVESVGAPGQFALHEIPEVQQGRLGRLRGGLKLSQEVEVVDQRLQPFHVVERPFEQVVHVDLAGMQPGLLQLCPQPRDRGAQFVRHVGLEPPLPVDGPIQLAAHAVDAVLDAALQLIEFAETFTEVAERCHVSQIP